MLAEAGTMTLSMPSGDNSTTTSTTHHRTPTTSTNFTLPPSSQQQQQQQQQGQRKPPAFVKSDSSTAAPTEAGSSTLFGFSVPSSSQTTAPSSDTRSKGNRFLRCMIPCKRRCSRDDEYGTNDDKEEIRTTTDKESLEWDTGTVPAEGFMPPGHKVENASNAAAAAAAASTSAGCLGHLFGKTQLDDAKSDPGKSVEESCKRALEHFPQPSIEFPMPTLDFDFRLAVKLKPEPSRLEGAKAHKEITTISGGKWSGSFGNGNVLAGGYDLGQARGFRPIRIVEGAFVMQTTDEPPAVLEMRTRGSLSGPSDVLDALLSPRQPKDIDCRRYGFRMFSTIKTADKRYAEIVNCGLWVASGLWKDDEMIIDAYRVT